MSVVAQPLDSDSNIKPATIVENMPVPTDGDPPVSESVHPEEGDGETPTILGEGGVPFDLGPDAQEALRRILLNANRSYVQESPEFIKKKSRRENRMRAQQGRVCMANDMPDHKTFESVDEALLFIGEEGDAKSGSGKKGKVQSEANKDQMDKAGKKQKNQKKKKPSK